MEKDTILFTHMRFYNSHSHHKLTIPKENSYTRDFRNSKLFFQWKRSVVNMGLVVNLWDLVWWKWELCGEYMNMTGPVFSGLWKLLRYIVVMLVVGISYLSDDMWVWLLRHFQHTHTNKYNFVFFFRYHSPFFYDWLWIIIVVYEY